MTQKENSAGDVMYEVEAATFRMGTPCTQKSGDCSETPWNYYVLQRHRRTLQWVWSHVACARSESLKNQASPMHFSLHSKGTLEGVAWWIQEEAWDSVQLSMAESLVRGGHSESSQ
jgi:hypothetical protein